MEAFIENNIEWLTGDKQASITATEKKMKSLLRKYAESDPDDVDVVAVNKDGSMFVHVPRSWVVIRKPKKMELTDEQREALAEQMRSMRKCKAQP